MTRVCLGVAVLLVSGVAWGHKGSDAYWSLTADGARLTGRLDVALVDLDYLLGLDGNADGALTWREVQAGEAVVRDALGRHLALTQDGTPCTHELGALQLVRHSDGNYVSFAVRGACPRPVEELEVRYALLFEADPTHRGLLSVQGQGEGHWLAFTNAARTQQVSFRSIPRGEQAWLAFAQGMHHIAIGWDHLCFLFALLLPSVLRRVDKAWAPRDAFRPSFFDVLRVVTAFTVAHSITLALAAFGVVAPNAHAVEVAIALSVALAAFNNLMPFVPDTRWSLAFSLGLLHGFGFVSAIADLGTDDATRTLSVLCFNLGVEAGQLAIVAAFVPVAWLLRGRAAYRRVLVPLGSAVILGVALYWTVERL